MTAERTAGPLSFAALETKSESLDPATVGANTGWIFWGGDPLPHIVQCVERLMEMRGTVDFVLVTPDSVRRWVPELPDSWWEIPSWGQRSDVLAAFLLRNFGGLYLDADMWPVVRVDRFIQAIQSRDTDFLAFSNQQGQPAVSAMWSVPHSSVTTSYVAKLEEVLAQGNLSGIDWTALGAPLLMNAIEDAASPSYELPPMVGNTAMFSWELWRTLSLPVAGLEPYLEILPNEGRSLAFVNLFNNKSGEQLADPPRNSFFDIVRGYENANYEGIVANASSPGVTFISKTFNRPKTAAYAVERTRRAFPDVPFILLDDGDDDHRADLTKHQVAHFVMEFDSGLSAGRNVGIRHVSTDYFALFDDDAIPSPLLPMADFVKLMDSRPDLDAIGGWEQEQTPIRSTFEVSGSSVIEQPNTAWSSIQVGGRRFLLHHMVQNILIGRTTRFKSTLKWNEAFKVGEHVEFYFRLRGELKAIFHPDLRFENVPSSIRDEDAAETDYETFRKRQRRMWRQFKRVHGISSFVVRDGIITKPAYETRPWRTLLRMLNLYLFGERGKRT